MSTKYSLKIKPALGLSLLLTCSILASCGSKSAQVGSPATESAAAPASSAKAAAKDALNQGDSAPTPAKPVVQALPQLIKSANISVRVKSIEPAVAEIKNLVKQLKGDIYNFEDQKPNDDESHHRISMEIKVPQAQLDVSLERIAKLGSITNQKVKAEDVTNQLVDIDARLKNLRQEEATISKIMDRTGSIKDVLSVSQELSRVRSEIETIDATQKSLRGQVAYSTINLELEESVAKIKDSGNPLGTRISETWNSSTHVVGESVTNLGLLVVWLIPFIPLFVLGGAAFSLYRRVKPSVKKPEEVILDPIE